MINSHEDDLNLPASKGIYLLVFHLLQDTEIEVGKLGKRLFRAGWWFYIGSAYGPGGLRARVKHHIAREHKRLHWHMDYLRPYTRLVEIFLFEEAREFEHQIADYFRTEFKLAYPVSGFGASDCGCPSHLFYSPKQLDLHQHSCFRHSRHVRPGGGQ